MSNVQFILNQNKTYDPHNNTMSHRVVQQIINIDRENTRYDSNTGVNRGTRSGIDATTSRGTNNKGSTNNPANNNIHCANSNATLNGNITSHNTKHKNNINRN